MLSNYEMVLLPIRVPVGVCCFNSNEPFPVTCENLDVDDYGDGGCYPKCLKYLGDLKYTDGGIILKPRACLRLKGAE